MAIICTKNSLLPEIILELLLLYPLANDKQQLSK